VKKPFLPKRGTDEVAEKSERTSRRSPRGGHREAMRRATKRDRLILLGLLVLGGLVVAALVVLNILR
jgi:hypothetical protein